ncbi:MAG: lysophospholipid acyltransferase family protein [Lentisphaerae bacterium]|nr:lysophospholipid acyltransferase family protein [Lentisphaerota bacterium]
MARTGVAAVKRIFTVPNPYRDPVRHNLFMPVGWTLERVLGLESMNGVYRRIKTDPVLAGRPFLEQVLGALDVGYRVAESDRARIPTRGPAIVAANHCFGGLEGLLLGHLLRSVRPDVKILANYLIGCIPELRELFIFVDPFGRRSARHTNAAALREALRWLRAGGVLGLFPSGEVARYDMRRHAVEEPAWSAAVGSLARRTQAPVVPVFFEGQNGAVFHALGLLHPRLRTVRLPRELLNKLGRLFPVHVGNPIPFRRLQAFRDDAARAAYLRLRTYHLGNRRAGKSGPGLPLPVRRGSRRAEAPAAAVPRAELLRETAALPPDQRLVVHDAFEVWVARAPQIPRLLREIGRLREVSFRAGGEGTGRALDLDRFDAYYLHLFLWNRGAAELAGAYRLGPTDEILPRFGVRGLYTSRLFRYRRGLLDRIDPALEMGRSFVCPEYQRNYLSLYLLWKGIAAYLVRHPRYRILFGPVSISDEYNSVSRELLVSFLKMNNYMPDLARLVKARTPLRRSFLHKLRRRELRMVVDSVEEVEALIADVQSELKGIPILLKQYLKLGGRLLGFNLDPAFANVLDGLILVDVSRTDRRVLQRYVGAEGMQRLLAHWAADAARPAA